MPTQIGHLVLNCPGEKLAQEIEDCLVGCLTQKGKFVHSKTLQLLKRNNQLSNRITYLLIITLEPSPIPSQI